MTKSYSLFLAAALVLTFTQCKKKETLEQAAAPEKKAHVKEVDENPLLDDATTYALSLLSNHASKARLEEKYKPCGAVVTVDTLPVSISQKKKSVRLTFDATIECTKADGTIKKQGYIEFQLTKGDSWDEVGAEITKTYAGYKEFVTCLECASKQEPFEFNGIETITNLSGGLIEEATIGSTIKHAIKSTNMTLKDDKGVVRIQNVSEIITGKKTSATDFEFSLIGTGAFDGKNNVAMWGTTAGVAYQMIYNSPKTYNTCNGNGKLVSGETLYLKGSEKTVETYGVTKKGELEQNCSAYGYKSVVTKANGQVSTTIYKY